VYKRQVRVNVKPMTHVEKQVIIHCSIPCEAGMGMRIWKSTYLITEDGTKIPLVHWEGISLAPEWTLVLHEGFFRFTLVFNGLPSNCSIFSMQEIIPESGGFKVDKIKRTKSDVYHVNIL
jgi:hypothetical protein